jgi:membrane-associated phospholipid phosphatase/MFS family permease
MSPAMLARSPSRSRLAVPLFAFSLAAVGAGAGRALTTTYLPVLLERIEDAPSLIGAVMTVNAVAGFAVPIAIGMWSDRRGRRVPFIAGGAVLTAGGLVAVALGNGSSYLALGLAAALVYTGLNALTTAHRAIVAEDVEDRRRPAATSAQELAGLGGAVLAVAIGGALIEPAPGAAFALATAAVALSVIPTLLVSRRLGLGEPGRRAAARAERVRIGEALRRRGAREVLAAQVLWVFAYAALPSFFVLYAEDSLGLGVGAAGALPLGFGVMTAAGMVAAGRARPERVRPLLLAGAGLLGAGLLAAAPAQSLVAAAPAFAAAAVGAGLVTALGFPYFARFVPEGEAGRYSGLFFAGRAVASGVALPLAGVAVELSGSYRAVLLLGAAGLVALAPLALAERRRSTPAPLALRRRRSRAVAALRRRPAVLALRRRRPAALALRRRRPAALARWARSGAALPGRSTAALRPRPATVGAVIPVFASDRAAEIALGTLRHVDEVVLVDDGAPPEVSRSLDALAGHDRVRVLRLAENGGKGTAVAAGAALLLAGPRPPEAIVVLDSDGQHDPERIPAFVEAARRADAVLGHRRDRRSMPLDRRIANRAASLVLLGSARRWVPDCQNGMRLFRTDVLRELPLPAGGYDAESRHLRALLATGRAVASVEIPTIYDGEPSHFRPLADTLRVARALAAPASRPREAAGTAAEALGVLRLWGPRLGASLLAAVALGAALPVLQPLDNSLFLALNGLGDGPEWLYRALDPHTRNYILLVSLTVIAAAVVLRRPRYVVGAGLAVLLGAYVAGAGLELVKLFIERARPEEVLGAQVQLSHGRNWAHLASFPSGHLIVTAAMASAAAAAVPRLRAPLLLYVGLVGLTRMTFGAHFPLDVVAGAVLGYELGLFSARLVASARLLPEPRPVFRPLSVPQPAPGRSRVAGSRWSPRRSG